MPGVLLFVRPPITGARASHSALAHVGRGPEGTGEEDRAIKILPVRRDYTGQHRALRTLREAAKEPTHGLQRAVQKPKGCGVLCVQRVANNTPGYYICVRWHRYMGVLHGREAAGS